ncbi:hypothetical protein HOLDEFILI_03220 [Holdemania filiformis DSM 12042]|uniref:Uncharacterized protein n=1 Tax=Holdemania filiformis DSM 12042 TaxID=545696 RepID=B9YBL3_9FIRM|nr:hypothetical protein HOLDEFILI_03220 [Holdemania filiformis DSM 12042]
MRGFTNGVSPPFFLIKKTAGQAVSCLVSYAFLSAILLKN